MHKILPFLLLLIACWACEEAEKPPLDVVELYEVDDVAFDTLEVRLQQLAAESNGRVGIYVFDSTSGRELGLNAEEFFPLASVYKVPIVATLMQQVDNQQLRLDSMVVLSHRDRRHSGCFMDDSSYQASYKISIGQLAALMLINSDNCATDAVLRIVGGPAAVQQQLDRWQVEDVHVNRYLIELFANLVGKELPGDVSSWSFNMATSVFQSAGWDSRRAGRARLLKDLRDQGTPLGVTQLNKQIYRGELLSDSSSQWIVAQMAACRTGEEMIPTDLPNGYLICHKTGSLPGIYNDAGWLEKEGMERPLFYAVFTKGSTRLPSKDKDLFMRIMETLVDYRPLKRVQ